MPSCVFKHCKSCSQKHQKERDGISFHRFPSNSKIADIWTSIVRRNRGDQNWLPTNFSVACSLHFRDEDSYFSKKGRRMIRKTARPVRYLSKRPPKAERAATDTRQAVFVDVPAIKKENSSQDTSDNPENRPIKMERDSENETYIEIECTPTVDPSGSRPGHSAPDEYLGVSDLDSEPDDPVVAKLKEQLHTNKLLERKVKTIRECIRKLKNRIEIFENKLKDRNIIKDNEVANELVCNLFAVRQQDEEKKEFEYSAAFKEFSLALNAHSREAYQYVRDTFDGCMPDPATLKNEPTSSLFPQAEET